jgi:hypothetical protein
MRDPALCEADHIRRNFIEVMVFGNSLQAPELSLLGGRTGNQTMGHHVRSHQVKALNHVKARRSSEGERAWLSGLIDMMEQVSQEKASGHGTQAMPGDSAAVSALRTQLARPPQPGLRSSRPRSAA